MNTQNTENGNEVVLVATSRTAIGKTGGMLHTVDAAEMAAHVLKCAVAKAKIKHLSQIDKVVCGQAVQSYFAPNIARVATQMAGLPESIDCFTVQQQCASGMNALYQIYSEIVAGRIELGVAIGVESMSLTPLIVDGHERYRGFNKWLTTSSPKALRKLFKSYGPLPYFGIAETGLGPRTIASDPGKLFMLKTAQIVANMLDISREDADKYSAQSQERALRAIASGRFAREIDAMVIPGVGVIDTDEHPRKTNLASLAKLPTLAGTGLITAGNASGMGDGACAVVMCTRAMAAKLGVKPLARLVDMRFSGRHAHSMGLGPVNAVNDLLIANGLTVADIAYWELNEAFSYQALACIKVLGLDQSKVNCNGGGISLSHPLGMTGARIAASAAYELADRQGRYAVFTLCVGGGMGAAGLLELA
ncbi:MAG: thiolase family protein [Candidatus Obscuribacter sp.]|jgi:acetyl-CoA acetyltransferase family protein|nr:thiolase family protein [Candidatus Obscuribacter sp.]MBK7840231.1 thiolase family protein [Candidatus Obscuribacter sp.]MBK9204372.1 thiolase family protein [Candidatus Obscuribacter sp.]MBK9622184.1 thiolase family protein [Candidatus Obscuribacter sp.]MBL0186532.1 thiolase family protein [Candidatus Obscuribacter sp.]